MLNKYYNYILLNPSKPLVWEYNNIKLQYQPFYIGKGCNTRATDHYRPCSKDNFYTKNIINELKSGGFLPTYIIYNENVTEKEAFNEEINAIAFVRNKFGNILTNLTNGGDGFLPRIGKENHKSKSVYQYDKDTGEFIAEYESSCLAAKSLGAKDHTHLCACCRGERKTFLGFIWKYEKLDYITINKTKWDRFKFSKLIAISKENQILEFNSMKEAYEFLGKKNKGQISRVLKGERETFADYYWKIIK